MRTTLYLSYMNIAYINSDKIVILGFKHPMLTKLIMETT